MGHSNGADSNVHESDWGMATQSSEAELREKLRAGDATAWRIVFEQHYPVVREYITRKLGQRREADVDDVVAETFFRARRFCNAYDPALPVGPWLFRIAWNEMVKLLHAKGQTDVLPPGDIRLECPDGGHVASTEHTWYDTVRGRLENCLAELSAECRTLIQQRYFDNLSREAITESNDSTLGQYRGKIQRCKAALRKCLERRGVQEA